MHKLLRTQQPDNQELLSSIFDWQGAQLSKLRQAFYSARSDKHISLNENWKE